MSLFKKVEIVNECWNYTGVKNRKGYGKIRVGSRKDGSRKMVSTHRLAWELTNGSIPDSMHVLHHCDNPSCIKPGHLFLGTNQDNMTDMANKGRSSKKYGTNNPSAKLSNSQVLEIKERLCNGETAAIIANDYPVTRGIIYHIKNGRAWNHIRRNQ